MKKIILMLTIVLCIFGLTGCQKGKYTSLGYDEFQKKLEQKDTFAIVFGSSTCSACKMYKNTIEEVLKDNNIEIFYLGLDEITDDQYTKIYSKYVIKSTPTTIFFKNGEEITTYDRIVGASNYSEVVEKLKKYGIIGG